MFKRIFVNALRTLKNAPAEGVPSASDWPLYWWVADAPAPSELFLGLKYPSNSMPIKRETEHTVESEVQSPQELLTWQLNGVSHCISYSKESPHRWNTVLSFKMLSVSYKYNILLMLSVVYKIVTWKMFLYIPTQIVFIFKI